ncbi:ANTAR domain-containing response regulator [Comamonas sp. GB3 AK4-5]|uniref:ANTAR domain-containing response regulator n=1 Tax=Comamonas sp. GB3 AK4-5 TaxID=3231487 RepID=UPI00351F556B
MDGMHGIEMLLAEELEQRCRCLLQAPAAATATSRAPDASLPEFFRSPEVASPRPPGSSLPPSGLGPGLAPQLEQSVLALVQEQAQRLQAMHTELASARSALTERKTLEHAKGLLMAHRQLSESEAHKLLRQTAMNQNRRLQEVAEAVLAMAELLPLSQGQCAEEVKACKAARR